MPGKASIILQASAAHIATHTVFDGQTPEGVQFDSKRALRTFTTLAEANSYHYIVVVTAVTATPSIVFTWDGYDMASATWYNLLTSTAISTTGTTVFKFGTYFNGVANLTSHDMLPERWRLVATHGNADSATYSVGLNIQ